MSRNCKLISTYFGTRRRYPYNCKDAIEVLKDNIEHERTMDPGVDNLDIILVNHDCSSIDGNNYINSLEGIDLYCGKVRVIHRPFSCGSGVSMSSFDYGFKELRDEYDYWFFQEDDYKILESGYYGIGVGMLDSDEEVAFLAYDTVKGSLSRYQSETQLVLHILFGSLMLIIFGYIKYLIKFVRSLIRIYRTTNKGIIFAEGGMGLTHTKYLGEVIDKYGMMPHNTEPNPRLDEEIIKEYNGGNKYGDKFSLKRYIQVNRYFTWYWLQAVSTEFPFTAVFNDMGYRIELYKEGGGYIYSYKIDEIKYDGNSNIEHKMKI
jgi:hypothetical protein